MAREEAAEQKYASEVAKAKLDYKNAKKAIDKAVQNTGKTSVNDAKKRIECQNRKDI